MNSEVAAYLARMRLPPEVLPPTLGWLRRLHRAHLETVPFENLDIGRGRPLSLMRTTLFDKIVTRRRGGICYELNGLFAWLLSTVGYEVELLSASDSRGEDAWSLPFDHLTLAVRCPADEASGTLWLADVGWGDSFLEPIRLQEEEWQPEGRRAYRLETAGDYQILWQRDFDGYTERQYRFSRRSHALSEFAPMCLYHQVSPRSSFTQGRLCTRARPDGRVTLRNNRLIETVNGEKSVTPVADSELATALAQHFGVVIPD